MFFALFDTPVGRCAIAWGPRGVIGLQLPEKTDAKTRDRLKLRAPDAVLATPPREIQRVIDDVVAHLSGRRVDLSHIALDLEGVSDPARRVYEGVRAVPVGATSSAAELAARVGGTSRTVTAALAKNPFAILVPCHRVLSGTGRIAASTNGSDVARIRMLTTEASHAPAHFEGDGELGFDPDVALAHLRGADPQLGAMIDRIGPYTVRLKRTPSIFVALAESIVYQQLSGSAAGTIWARVRALFPHGHAGPTPAQIMRATDESLLGAGLSRNKLLAIRDLAKRATEGSIPTLREAQRLDDETLVDQLTLVRGIGRWTVEMLLMFRLGRPDLLPVDDLGIQKGFAVTFRKKTLPTKDQMRARGERWRPYRSVASWYFWRAADLKS